MLDESRRRSGEEEGEMNKIFLIGALSFVTIAGCHEKDEKVDVADVAKRNAREAAEFNDGTEASAETVLRALCNKSLTNDVEFALSAWTAIGSAIESHERFDKFRLMQRLADVVVPSTS